MNSANQPHGCARRLNTCGELVMLPETKTIRKLFHLPNQK
jgi:hypothetical protein